MADFFPTSLMYISILLIIWLFLVRRVENIVRSMAEEIRPHIVALVDFVLQEVDHKLCWILQAFQPVLCKRPHRQVTWRSSSRMHAAR